MSTALAPTPQVLARKHDNPSHPLWAEGRWQSFARELLQAFAYAQGVFDEEAFEEALASPQAALAQVDEVLAKLAARLEGRQQPRSASASVPWLRLAAAGGVKQTLSLTMKEAGDGAADGVCALQPPQSPLDALPDAAQFTAAEKERLEFYVESSDAVNTVARTVDRKSWSAAQRADITAMDNLLAKSVLKADTTVYRGIDSSILGELKPGAFFEDRGFVSTTSDLKTAGTFGNTILEIRVPAGTRAINMQRAAGLSEEAEILLERKLDFRVLRTEGNRVIVEASYAR